MLKKLMLTSLIASGVFFTSFQSHALDVTPKLSQDGETIMEIVEKTLEYNFTDAKKVEIFNKVFKAYADNNGWKIKPVNKTNYIQSKEIVSKDEAHYVDYVFSYDSRTVFISLINYPRLKQLVATLREVVPVSKADVVSYYNIISKNADKNKDYDDSNFSMFSDKTTVNYTNYHVSESNGVVIYSLSSIIEY